MKWFKKRKNQEEICKIHIAAILNKFLTEIDHFSKFDLEPDGYKYDPHTGYITWYKNK